MEITKELVENLPRLRKVCNLNKNIRLKLFLNSKVICSLHPRLLIQKVRLRPKKAHYAIPDSWAISFREATEALNRASVPPPSRPVPFDPEISATNTGWFVTNDDEEEEGEF